MPNAGPPLQPILFEPTWKIPPDIDQYEPEDKLLRKCRKVHRGLKRILIAAKVEKEDPSTGQMKESDEAVRGAVIPHPRYGVAPELPPERIAQVITAIAAQYATRRNRVIKFKATFYGVPEDPKAREPRAYSSFVYDGTQGVRGTEEEPDEAEEEAADEEDDALDDDELDEDDGGDGYDDEDDDDDDDDWPADPGNPYARPRMGHEPGVTPYPHVSRDEYRAAFPPGAAPSYPHAQQMGQYTNPNMGLPGYQQSMHPAQALMMHHIGGLMAESRAQIREMREDMRHSRAEADRANRRLLEMMNLSRSHYENMHRASQTGWNALHQGMSMQLNALQNSMAWERKIMQLESANDVKAAEAQGGGNWMQALMALAPMLMGGIGQVMHHVKGLPGEPPPLLPPEAVAAMMGGGPEMGGPPPGMVPPGMEGAPPQAPTPPPGFAGTPPPPPPGFPAGGSAPEPPPGFPGAPPPPTPPGFQTPEAGPSHEVEPGQAPPWAAPEAPLEPELVTPDSVPTGDVIEAAAVPKPPPPPEPSAPPSSDLGRVRRDAQSNGAVGIAVGMHNPNRPMTQEEVRARFMRAPLACMVDTILRTTEPSVHSALADVEGDVWSLMGQIALADTDQDAQEDLRKLHAALDEPGRLASIVSRLSPEQAHMLSDVKRGIDQSLTVTGIMGNGANGGQSVPGSSTDPSTGAASPGSGPFGMPLQPTDPFSPPPFQVPEAPPMPEAPLDESMWTGDPVLDGGLAVEVVPTSPTHSVGNAPRKPNPKKGRRRKRKKGRRK